MWSSFYHKITPVFWIAYFLLVPLSTSIFHYRYMPNELYDKGKDSLLASHTGKLENSGKMMMVPDIWRNRNSNIIYKNADFWGHRKSEKKRLSLSMFAYGLVGCLAYTCNRKTNANAGPIFSFSYALLINILVAVTVLWMV